MNIKMPVDHVSTTNPDTNPYSCEAHNPEYKNEVGTVPHILDSGDRTQFESGAVRDMRVGKGRCDLMPLDVVAELVNGDDEFEDSMFWFIHRFQETDDVGYLYKSLEWFHVEYGWDVFTMLLEVSIHFEDGAKKYGDNNWRKGIPVKVFLDSALRHYIKFLRGDKDEPHDRAVCWNLMCAIWTAKHKPELDDYRVATPTDDGSVG
jgi:hypothetical protein